MLKNSEPLSPIKIEDLSHDGRGVAHIKGKTVFIANALAGETVIFQYLKKRRSFDAGIATDILISSNDRVEPPCQYANMCGGCSLQHMNSKAQIQHKEKTLLNQLKHFGKVDPKNILPPLTSDTLGYRRKARLGVRYVIKKEKLLVGFREKNSRFLADIDECLILHENVGKKILVLKKALSTLNAFDHIPQIEVAVGDKKTALVIRHLKPLNEEDRNRLIQLAKDENFDIYLQPKGPDSLQKLWPNNTDYFLRYSLPDENLIYDFHPCQFTQVNLNINRDMVKLAIKFLEPQKDDVILDLFCGLGNFSLPLAKRCKHLIGVEGNNTIVKQAEHNAKLNHIDNVTFYTANLNDISKKAPWVNQSFDKILIDPPRSGAYDLIQSFPTLNAKRIVYISCNPATLARDAELLVHNYGYTLTQAGVMDMFPHTAHVESIAVFEQ